MTNRNNATTTNKGLWCKLAVDYQFDPKIMRAGFEAETLFLRGMAFAKRQDDPIIQFVSLAVIGIGLPDAETAADKLCEVGLWERTDEGWLIVSFAGWQETNKEKSEGGVYGNHVRYCINAGKPIPNCPHCESDTDSDTDSLDRSLEQSRTEQSRTDTSIYVSSSDADDFNTFWLNYPRKVGKQAAQRAWKATRKKRPPLEQVLTTLAQACDVWREGDPNFIPHPATWLNQGRWDDETFVVARSGRETLYDRNRRQIEENHRQFQAEAALAFNALGQGDAE